MDGRGAWRDNIFIERLWKTIKYERVSLYAYDSVSESRSPIMQYLVWYNQARPHSKLKKMSHLMKHMEGCCLRLRCQHKNRGGIPLEK